MIPALGLWFAGSKRVSISMLMEEAGNQRGGRSGSERAEEKQQEEMVAHVEE
jgi:hypothetical protein